MKRAESREHEAQDDCTRGGCYGQTLEEVRENHNFGRIVERFHSGHRVLKLSKLREVYIIEAYSPKVTMTYA